MALRFLSMLLCTISLIGFGIALPPPTPTGECGLNAERLKCGSACAPTCANRLARPCPLYCVDDCFCKSGYLKAASGQCVRPEECDTVPDLPSQQLPHLNLDQQPKCSNENEEYRTCGPICIPTCSMPLPKPWCPRHCSVGCYCKEGYLRDEKNQCIPATRCLPGNSMEKISNEPPRCPKDEEYNTCGVQLDCLASCKIPLTPKCLERRCTPGCVCSQPLVRHRDGRCVEKTQCQQN